MTGGIKRKCLSFPHLSRLLKKNKKTPNLNQRPRIHSWSALLRVLGPWFLNLVMKADYLNRRRRHEILQVDTDRASAFARFVWRRGSPLEPCHNNKALPAHQFTRGAKCEVTSPDERSGIHSRAQHFDVRQELADLIMEIQQAWHSSI